MAKRKSKPRVALAFGNKRVVVRGGVSTSLMCATLESKDGIDAMGAQRWTQTVGPREQTYAGGSTRRYWSTGDVESLLASIFTRLAVVKRAARRRKIGGAS